LLLFNLDKLIEHQLIEGNASEKIPIVSQLIEQYKASRSGIKASSAEVEKRYFNYLLEYFGNNKRIDLITPAEAAGIRDYLINKRTAGYGVLAVSSANRAVKAIKPIFNFAVDCDYLKKSPFAKVKGGSTASEKPKHYVTYEEIEAVIRLCGKNIVTVYFKNWSFLFFG
jgi:site-specific recombinase XerD